MIKRLRQSILHLRNQRALRKKALQQVALQFPVEDVLVLQRASQPMPVKSQQLLVKLLGISKDRLRFFTLADIPGIEESHNHFVLAPEDINFRGILPQDASRFCSFPVDLMFNYFNDSDVLLNYLSLKIKAGIRLGFARTDSRLNHIIFNFELTEEETLGRELPKYLKPILASA